MVWIKIRIDLFFNVYGPGQIKNSPMSAVIGIFETQYKNKQPLTIVKPGSQKRDFTHIDDIVRGCFWLGRKANKASICLELKKLLN